MSGVALAMLALFTYPIITSVLEPIFFRSKHSWFDIMSSLLVLTGLGLIVPEFSLGSKSMQGVLLGLLSSALYAVRNILNRRQIVTSSGTTIMCFQLLLCTLLLAPTLLVYPLEISPANWKNLVLLALITTAIAHTLFVKGLANFTASTVSILSCLTPIYGILWAVWLTDEQLTQSTVLGGSIIVIASLAQSYRHYQKSPHVTGTVQ
jgi:drug/metabolite transporter (DMT)-like permease